MTTKPKAPTAAEPDLTPPLAERAPDFCARVGSITPASPLVSGFVPGDGITLLHGHPRTLKSWMVLTLALCRTANQPAFGGLAVRPGPTLLITNEDSQARVAQRLDWLRAGFGLPALPADLWLIVGKGIWLDDPDAQDRLVGLVKNFTVDLVILDPLRSVTGCVDQGPRDLQPFQTYLRLLMRETGCAVLACHHDAKPAPGIRDDRKHPHRASGGGLYSIADAPIHVERIGDTNTVIATPCGWKFSDDPSPLEITLTVGDGAAMLTAKASTSGDAETVVLHDKILAYVQANPHTCGRKLAEALRGNRQRLFGALEQLYEAGRLDRVTRGQGHYWFVTSGSDQFHGSGTGAEPGTGYRFSPVLRRTGPELVLSPEPVTRPERVDRLPLGDRRQP